ncbi:MAG: hypothetical protein II933_03950 [Candidatus Methanomethylophilaceae archaeon]|nr:hypothetical protein [Candidatus Methanomethylophilaceae archaeon]
MGNQIILNKPRYQNSALVRIEALRRCDPEWARMRILAHSGVGRNEIKEAITETIEIFYKIWVGKWWARPDLNR